MRMYVCLLAYVCVGVCFAVVAEVVGRRSRRKKQRDDKPQQ